MKKTNFNLTNFGFQKINDQKFVKKINDQPINFNLIDWQDQDKFKQIIDLQRDVWLMDEVDLVPKNILSISKDTGGLIVLVENEQNEALGFAFCLGTRGNSWLLHMIGFSPNQRLANLGFNLSVFVGLMAKKEGVQKIIWTFDPLRGINANLNFAKLGATAKEYLINKYGQTSSRLYGQMTTDRLLVEWDLDKRTTSRILAVENQQPVKKVDLDQAELIVEIPADIDSLSEADKKMWRTKIRQILSNSLTIKPSAQNKEGEFCITDFVSQRNQAGERQNFFVLTRRSVIMEEEKR